MKNAEITLMHEQFLKLADLPKKKAKPYQITKDKFLNDREVAALESNLAKMLAIKPDRFLPILIAFKIGCRRSELLLLTPRSIDFDTGTVWIEATKGSADREIPVEPYVLELIKSYIQRGQFKSQDRLFKISVATIFRIWDEVNPCHKRFHSLRHTFAIKLYKDHRDLRLVQVALGHRNIHNTVVYAQYFYSTEELRRLIVWPQKADNTPLKDDLEAS